MVLFFLFSLYMGVKGPIIQGTWIINHFLIDSFNFRSILSLLILNQELLIGTYSMYTFNILPLTLKKKMFMTVIQKQNAPLAFSVDHLIWVEHLADTNKLDFNLAPIHEIYKSSQ